MSVFSKKDRMVSFRLSGPEYAAAALASSSNGMTSVSSFARDAVLRVTGGKRGSGPSDAEILIHLQHQVLQLQQQVNTLRADLDRLAATASKNLPAASRSIPLAREQAAGAD